MSTIGICISITVMYLTFVYIDMCYISQCHKLKSFNFNFTHRIQITCFNHCKILVIDIGYTYKTWKYKILEILHTNHTWGQRTCKIGAVLHGQENGPLCQCLHGHPLVHRTAIKNAQINKETHKSYLSVRNNLWESCLTSLYHLSWRSVHTIFWDNIALFSLALSNYILTNVLRNMS